jgi:Glycosyl transferase family 2
LAGIFSEENKGGVGTQKGDLYQPSSFQPPLISIIIATCQAAKSLPQSLDRFMAQNHLFIKLIIIDGDSKDETLHVTLA